LSSTQSAVALHSPRSRLSRSRLGNHIGRAIAAIILAAFICFFAVPLAWLIEASTKTSYQLQTEAPFALGNWAALAASWNQLMGFEGGAFIGWLGNSALYSVSALVVMLIASIPAGYALALTRFRLRKPLLVVTLVVMLMPNTALVLPTFLELNAVGLIGNPLSVILPFSFFPFGVYLTVIYFSTSVPRDLLSAARIDGCSELQVFLRIALPLALPIVALIGFFSFVQSWTNYFLPFVMLPSSNVYPIQVGLAQLGRFAPALAVLIAALPVGVLFVVFQRFLISGRTAGALASE